MPFIKKHHYHWMKIGWSTPKPLDDFMKNPHDYDKVCYALLVKNSRGRYVLAYIGHVYKQYVHNRIKQHRRDGLLKHIRRRLKNKSIFISIGEPYMEREGKVTHKRVKDAEKLLIYNHDPKVNKTNRKWIDIKEHYRIKNQGYLKGVLKKKIAFGPVII